MVTLQNSIKQYRKMNLKEQIIFLAAKYNCKIVGDLNNLHITILSSLTDSSSNSLIWASKAFFKKHEKNFTKKINSNCLITDMNESTLKKYFKADIVVITAQPKLVFTLIANFHLESKQVRKKGIHPSSVIHSKAVIHPSAYVGPLCYIGECQIGKNTSIEGHCYIKDNVEIGDNCRIDTGTVIGVEGTGHVLNEKQEWVQFPQIGKTIIEDNVEIGANTYVTRGALSNTHIKKGVIIGLDCGIGHNAIIEENSFITSKALIGGSSVIGKSAFVGMCAVIRDTITIGENAQIGMGAVVTKNVPDNETWFGNPARKV